MPDFTFKETLFVNNFTFLTSPAVFSPKKIDGGTRFLLENINIGSVKTILDIGCGYGALGIVLAKTHPEIQFTLVDENPEAISLAKQNALLNKLQNTRVVPVSALLIDQQFDLIISNIPWHQNKSAVPKIVSLAFDHLPAHAKFYVVTNFQFRTDEVIKKFFGNVQTTAVKPPYKILVAQRQDNPLH